MKKIYLQTALPSILYQNYIPCGRQYNTSTGTYDFYRYFLPTTNALASVTAEYLK